LINFHQYIPFLLLPILASAQLEETQQHIRDSPQETSHFQPTCATKYNDPSLACFDSVNSTLSLRHVDPGGIGYDHGYTTLAGLFFPGGLACNTVWPFVDLRAHYFNDNEWAASGGLGVRYAPDYTNMVLGVNAFFDYRTSGDWKLHYTQAGVGIEALGECWEFRVNGYLPIKRSNLAQRCDFFYPGDYFIRRDRFRNAMRGLSSELGHYFYRSDCFSLYAGVGPYFYRGRVDNNLSGGRFRVFLEYARWLTLGGIVYHDNVFKTRVQGLIGLNFSFGCAPKCCRREQIISQPVFRNEIIALDDFCCWKFNYDP